MLRNRNSPIFPVSSTGETPAPRFRRSTCGFRVTRSRRRRRRRIIQVRGQWAGGREDSATDWATMDTDVSPLRCGGGQMPERDERRHAHRWREGLGRVHGARYEDSPKEAPAGRGDEKRPIDLVGNQKSIAGFRKNYSVTVDHPADKRAAAD